MDRRERLLVAALAAFWLSGLVLSLTAREALVDADLTTLMLVATGAVVAFAVALLGLFLIWGDDE